jgi:hypothetical protein
MPSESHTAEYVLREDATCVPAWAASVVEAAARILGIDKGVSCKRRRWSQVR